MQSDHPPEQPLNVPISDQRYAIHRIATQPREWKSVAEALIHAMPGMSSSGIALYGIWRSQIGRPRDEVTVITTHGQHPAGPDAFVAAVRRLPGASKIETRSMTPTLRPAGPTPPTRQGNYAFRWFETPAEHWDEFLALCAAGWPGFEAAYDSQVIGLWRIDHDNPSTIPSLLLTRRPNLAMWERSKIPENPAEADVRAKLSRRYDLCDSTVVHTATLLTATDREDTARWT